MQQEINRLVLEQGEKLDLIADATGETFQNVVMASDELKLAKQYQDSYFKKKVVAVLVGVGALALKCHIY
jgi:hypothetical protein